MGSFIVVSVKMKLVISAFLPYLVFSQNVKLSGKLDAEALNNAFGGDNYYVQGDMIVNHGVINEAEGNDHGRKEIKPKFGMWFTKCFLNKEQREKLDMMKNEMIKSGGGSKYQVEDKGSGNHSKNHTAGNYRTRRSSHQERDDHVHDETNLMSNFTGMSDEMKDKLDEMDMDLDMMQLESFIDEMRIDFSSSVRDLVHVYMCLEKSYDEEVSRLRKKQGIEVMKGKVQKGDEDKEHDELKGDDKPQMGEKPENDQKPENGETSENSEKPEMNEKPENWNKPENGEKPEAGDKPEGHGNGKPGTEDKPGF